MGVFIEIVDCRGYTVVCTEEIWYDKILGSRPWMEGWENLVKEAIQTPFHICEDAKHKDRNAYYLLHVTKKDRYIKVIVKFNAKHEGFIISAYPTDSGKQKEKVIWMPSSD